MRERETEKRGSRSCEPRHEKNTARSHAVLDADLPTRWRNVSPRRQLTRALPRIHRETRDDKRPSNVDDRRAEICGRDTNGNKTRACDYFSESFFSPPARFSHLWITVARALHCGGTKCLNFFHAALHEQHFLQSLKINSNVMYRSRHACREPAKSSGLCALRTESYRELCLCLSFVFHKTTHCITDDAS